MRGRQSDETKKDIQDQNTAAHRKVRQEHSSQQRAVFNAQRRIGLTKADHAPLPPQVHYLDKMTEECSHCDALYLLGEQIRHPNGTYHPCCENGSVTLDKFERYPAQLAELFTGMHPESNNFLMNARNFNTALSIASMDYNLKNLPGRGPHVIKIFKISTSNNYASSLKPNTAEGKRIKELKVIIIGECSMISSDILKSIDNVLRDIMNQPDEPFGGKIVLMGEDFRQVLPTPDKPYGDGLLCSLKQCPLFYNFKKFELNENMRAHGESNHFKKLLLDIGEGKIPKDLEERIEIPTNMLSQGDLVQEIFEGVLDDPDHLSKRAILCAKNANVDQMNNQILERMSGCKKAFSSADIIVKDSEDDNFQLPIEVINSLAPSGLPPHQLELKIGAVVMLIRNLNVKESLCNGTRLQVLEFSRNNAIKCGFINEARKGQPVIIPRIDLLSTKGKGISFIFKRRQFPLKLAFAMTINKSQGQSLEKVGVSLIEEVFLHGQLYVAMSRVRKMEGIKLKLPNGSTRTANIVDKRAII